MFVDCANLYALWGEAKKSRLEAGLGEQLGSRFDCKL